MSEVQHEEVLHLALIRSSFTIGVVVTLSGDGDVLVDLCWHPSAAGQQERSVHCCGHLTLSANEELREKKVRRYQEMMMKQFC